MTTTVNFIYKRKQIKIETDDIVLFEKVRRHLSVPNPNSRYMSSFASDTFSPISPLGYFAAGLIYTVMQSFKKFEPLVRVTMDDKVRDIVMPIKFKKDEIEYFSDERFEDREYQRNVIRESLGRGRCLFELPTSSGKSFIIYSICMNLLKKHHQIQTILVLVPNLQLVKQLHGDFLEYGCNPGLVQSFSSFSDELNDAPVIIANRQWLAKHSEELPEISAVFIDEVQQLSTDNDIADWVDKLPTQIRFGCSGTIPKDKIVRWGIVGIVGPIICSVKSHEMQKNNYIAKIDIKPIRFDHIDKPYWERTDDNFDKMHILEYEYIENHDRVMQFICKFALGMNKNTLIMFDHTDHGERMFAMLQGMSTTHIFRFINGEVPVEDREDTRRIMEKNDNVILVANCKAAGVGLSIKNLHNIIFAMSGKAETKIIQAIGRMLRMNDNKIMATLYDFYHNLWYSESHFGERVKLYRDHYRKNVLGEVKAIRIRK